MRLTLPPLSRDKADTLLLLGATVLVLAPHALHLPLWVTLMCGATLAWRAALTLGGRRMPPALVLLPLAAAAMAGVMRSYQTLLGRDAGVAMLVLLVAFKLLEMHARRELYVVVFLCFFLLLTNFFYSQSIGTALLMLAALLALLTTLLSFQFGGQAPPLGARVRLGARMLAWALPVAALLFVGFPRIEGPLWGLPGVAPGGRSGLSEEMSPGQLASLAQSDDVAFRVRFEGAPPPPERLYWRGPVLGAYDGKTWRRLDRKRGAHEGVALSAQGSPVRYQVTLEPSESHWLFALDLPGRVPRLSGNPSFASAELELTTTFAVGQRTRYDAVSWTDYRYQATATLPERALWLALPAGRNPRALAAGRQLAADPDPARRVAAVLRQFRAAPFVYTLSPPLLGRDAVDEFLYRTRAGFCEHYAGAFVFLMRAAGVPARVVTGYQGGEPNPLDGFVTVRQADAHAWAEVWLAGRGWLRVDPTAAVAPERVTRGAGALPRPAPFGLGALGGAGVASWTTPLRQALDAVSNGWHQWVLNYTPERQRKLLTDLREVSASGGLAAGLAGLALLAAACWWWRQRRRRDPVDALYSALCQRLARHGLARSADEGPQAYAARVAASALAPAQRDAAVAFLRRYSAYRYGRPQPDPGLVPTLQRLLAECR